VSLEQMTADRRPELEMPHHLPLQQFSVFFLLKINSGTGLQPDKTSFNNQ
jgi:hypothetical protein